jgi:hypothetical protein
MTTPVIKLILLAIIVFGIRMTKPLAEQVRSIYNSRAEIFAYGVGYLVDIGIIILCFYYIFTL